MSQTTTCAVCGGEIIPGTEFCRFCGSPVGVTATVEEKAVEEVAVLACPQCGAPIKPGQKFCGSCGGVLEASATPAATSPTVAVGGTAPATVVNAPNADTLKQSLSKASSKLDSFMGATLDLDAVGKDFDPSSIALNSFKDEDLEKAFAFFGKSLNGSSNQEAASVDNETETPRSVSEDAQAKEARSKESRDFTAKAGTTVFGALSSQLHSEFAPKAEMVAQQRGDAANKEKKDRLKHKVALGEMDKRSAVDQAEE